MASALTLHSEALTKQKVSSIARNERECLGMVCKSQPSDGLI